MTGLGTSHLVTINFSTPNTYSKTRKKQLKLKLGSKAGNDETLEK